jgi:hypothetical protein
MRVQIFSSLGGLVFAAGLGLAQTPQAISVPPYTPPVWKMPAPSPRAVRAAISVSGQSADPTAPAAPVVVPPPPAADPAAPAAAAAAAPPAYADAHAHDAAAAPPRPDLGAWYAAVPRGPQTWAGVEYLLWWVRPGPVGVPLVNTTFIPTNLANNFAAGGLADPNAATIFGPGNSFNYGTFSGLRGYAGAWLDRCQTVGVEASGFFLGRRSDGFSAASGANGLPTLILPFNSVTPGQTGETGRVLAGPFGTATLVGGVGISSSSQLWGSDADLLYCLHRGEFGHIDAIGGFKYLGLDEGLSIAAAELTGVGGATLDQFSARNRFYGGELGARVTGQWDRFGLQGTAKVALGDTHQTLDIGGTSAVGGAVVPGGFFATSSNSGRTTADRFGVVPQLGLNLSYDVTCHLKLYVGYNWLYWTNVVRPGGQLDHNINTNLTPVFGGGAAGAGPAEPARQDRRTDFWAHGVSFGLAWQY